MTERTVPPGTPQTSPAVPQRRLAMQGLLLWPALSVLPLASCGGGEGAAPGSTATVGPAPAPSASATSSTSPPPPPPSPPPPTPALSPLSRLKAALLQAPLLPAVEVIRVTQGQGNNPVSGFGDTAQVLPPLRNQNTASLATLDTLWGHRRDVWSVPAAGQAVIAGVSVYPVRRIHPAATLGSESVCALHFSMHGQALEVLFAGSDPSLTVIANGRVMGGGPIETAREGDVRGGALDAPNTFVRIDFGSASARQVSLYARSSQGPCAIAVAGDDHVQPWDRANEASMCMMADSYGGGPCSLWHSGGPMWEAAALLGIAHIDGNVIGGTGYAPNSAPGFGHAGDAFPARVTTAVQTAPDLFITAGGINDNNSQALFPYASVESAQSGFEDAVGRYYTALRAALPQSVLVALGPWAPKENTPTNPVALSKAAVIERALSAAGGPWIYLDNLQGGWRCSSGASDPGNGPWQTGTGNTGEPNGTGNGDTFVSADGTHPTLAGVQHLGALIATGIRAALATL